MRKRRFNLWAWIMLIFWVAVLIMWVRSSANIIDYAQWTDARHFPGLVSSGGRVIFDYQFWPNGAGGNTPGFGAGSRPGVYWPRPDKNDPNTWADSRNYLLGFEWSPKAGTWPKNSQFLTESLPTTFVVAVPYWFLFMITSVLGLRSLLRRAPATEDEKRCLTCGYDLRATSDRCPECGMAIFRSAKPPAASCSDNP